MPVAPLVRPYMDGEDRRSSVTAGMGRDLELSDDIVLFLGAGASLPRPAGGPLFAPLRDACAKRAGADPRGLYDRADVPPALLLLEHVIPEVFLKEFSDAGYELREPLIRAVAGSPGVDPNAVHRLAADAMAAGGRVWTTNWDTWIERAWNQQYEGRDLAVAVAPDDDPSRPAVRLFKLHGCASQPASLRFATPDIMRPLAMTWHDRLVEAVDGKAFVVAGYAGADVDLFPALTDAIRASRVTYWLEGTGQQAVDESQSAAYEQWRFSLDSVAFLRDLPSSGAHLVWCGNGSPVSGPSEGLLAIFGYDGDVSDVPSWNEQFSAVDAEISQAVQSEPQLGPRLQLSARINERLGRRWRAALRHAPVVLVGPSRYREKSVRSLGNLVLLRTQPLRTLMTRAAVTLMRNKEREEFLALQSGHLHHDAERAARIADGREEVAVDTALTVAGATRWAGDLRVAERIARTQFKTALAEDLSSRERDWPERVSRACFELAQTLTWQGRLYEADQQARSAYMRVSGAKWTAWEYTFRAIVRFAQGQPQLAGEHLESCVKLLIAEGFRDFTPQVWCQRAACARVAGDLSSARTYLAEAERVPRKGPGSLATVLAERAEMANALGKNRQAVAAWSVLTESELPLWSALAHLRLAEQQRDVDANASAALAKFEAIGTHWGILRTAALLGHIGGDELRARTVDLGPTDVFRPGRPWLF